MTYRREPIVHVKSIFIRTSYALSGAYGAGSFKRPLGTRAKAATPLIYAPMPSAAQASWNRRTEDRWTVPNVRPNRGPTYNRDWHGPGARMELL